MFPALFRQIRQNKKLDRRPSPKHRPFLECLEDRSLLSTSTWIGGGFDSYCPLHQPEDSNPEAWSNPLNWLEHVVPGPGDTAVFPADFTIAVCNDNPVIAPFDRTAVVDVPVTIAGISIPSSSVSNRGFPTINLAQNLTLTGASEWDLGAINTGPGTLTNNGTFTMDPIEGLNGAHIVFGFGRVINNGTVIQQGTAALALRGTFTNAAGAVYDVQAEGSNVIGSDGQFINAGIVEKSTGTGASNVVVAFTNNGGTLDVESGTLRPGNATYNGGTFTVAAGATLDWGGFGAGPGGTITGSITGSGGGTVLLGINGHVGVGSGGATLNFSAGLFQWTGGGLSLGANNLTNLAGSFITIAGLDNKAEDAFGGGVLTNAGTITQQGDGRFDLRGTLLNQRLYDLQAEGNNVIGGDGQLINAMNGTFEKSAGTGASNIQVAFTNNGGLIDVESGTLRPGNAAYNGATFTVAAGATLDWGGTGAGPGGTITGSITGSGGGTVLLGLNGNISVGNGGATLNFSAGLFQWTGGGINLGPNNLTNLAGSFITIAGLDNKVETAFGGGVLTNAGTIIRQGTGGFGLRGTLLNQGLFDLQSDTGFGSDGTFVNQGTFQKSSGAGTAALDTFFSNPGTVLALSGILAVDFDTTEIFGNMLTDGIWQVFNGARLTLNSGVNLTTNNATVVLDGSGSIFTNVANLAINGGTFQVLDGAAFTSAGNLTDTGTLTVGLGSMFTVSGNYTQGPNATLEIQLGGTVDTGLFGQLAVTGNVTLDGTLTLTLVNGYTPSTGDAFQIMTFASRNGTDFANPPAGFGEIFDDVNGNLTVVAQ
jgi:hypothetical protein